MTYSAQTSDSAIIAELGARLAQHRLNRNLTRDALAERAGVSHATLARLESGASTSVQNLIRVLRALNLIGNLEALVPEPPPSPMQQLATKKRQRRRASRKRTPPPASPWKWGEE